MDKHDLNEFNEKQLEDLDVITQFSPKLRSKLFKVMGLLFLSFYSGYLNSKIAPEGYFLDSLLSMKINFLHIKITHNMLSYPLIVIGLLSFFSILFIYMNLKCTVYKITDYDLEINRGIFFKDQETTPWVFMKDASLDRTPIQYILSLANVIIYSKQDKSDPELHVNGLSLKDARRLDNFIRTNAVKNLPQYRMIEEKKKERKKLAGSSERKSPYNDGEFDDDSSSR